MTKILKKDIVIICNCIQSLSYEHIKENEKHAFNKGFISWYNIKPYTCKEVKFLFYKDDYKIVLTADNKKDMYIKLLEMYKHGLNNWIELYYKDSYKTKREKNRMNHYINKLKEFEKLVQE